MKQSLVLVLVSLLAITSWHNCDAFTRPKRCAEKTPEASEETTTAAVIPPGFCDQATIYCTDYNGLTLFIDATSKVNHTEDTAHCKSLGAQIYIPETEADNLMMWNFLREINEIDANIEFLAYPLIVKSDALFWKDEQGTTFDSGTYWKSPDISLIECYYIAAIFSPFEVLGEKCYITDDHHLCVFS